MSFLMLVLIQQYVPDWPSFVLALLLLFSVSLIKILKGY